MGQQSNAYNLYPPQPPHEELTSSSCCQLDDRMVQNMLDLLHAPDVEVMGGALHMLVLMVDHLPGSSGQIISLDGVETIENLQYAPISDEAIRLKSAKLAEKLIEEEEEQDMGREAQSPPRPFEFTPPPAGVGRGREMTRPAWQTLSNKH